MAIRRSAARPAMWRTCRSTACCTHGPSWRRRRTRASSGIDTSAALAVPGVVAVLTADDLPIVGGGGRTAEPLAREEIVFSGQPVALVVAETRRGRRGRRGAGVRRRRPAPAGARPRGRDGARLRRAPRDHRGPAAATAPAARTATRPAARRRGRRTCRRTSPAPAPGARRRRRGARRAPTSSSPARFRTQLDPPGLPRAAVRAGVDLDPDGALVINSSTQGAFMARQGARRAARAPARPRARAPGAARRRVRRQAHDPRAAGGAAALEARPPGPARASTAWRTSPPRNPAPGQLIDLELGATREGKLTAIRGRDRLRPRRDRGLGRRGRSPRCSPPARTGGARTICTAIGVLHQPRRRRRLPRARRAAGGVRGRDAARPARGRARARPDRAAAAQRARRRATAGFDGQQIKSVRRARVPRARPRAPAVARAAATLPDGEGIGVALGFWPGGLEPAAAICRLDADGKLTIVTAAADMSGIENAFATIAAETFGLAEENVRVVDRRHGAARRSAASRGGSKITYTVRARGPARRRRGARAAAAGRGHRARDRRRRTSSSSTARSARSARPAAAISIADLAPRRSPSARRTSRSRATAAVAQTSRAPGAAAHLSHVRVDRETGAVTRARARDRPGRRQGAQPGAGRGPDARRHRAGHRLGAARGARPRRGRPAARRLLRRVRDAVGRRDPADRDADRRGPGAGRPVRRQGHRRAAGGRRPARDRQRHRGGHRRPDDRAADDAAARLDAR